VLFLLALALMGFVMKFVVLLLPATIPAHRPHVFWLLLSPASNRRLRPIESVRKVLLRTVLLCGALVLTYWIYWNLLRVAHVRGIALSYGAVPVLLLMSETFVAFASVLWLPSGRMLPPIHDRPWRARSVADFWGNRWNLWFSDWSRYAIFQRLRRRPVFALVLAFAVSGLLHEWVINVPLYFVTGRVLFGTILLYFLIQAVGVLVERRFKRHPAWMIVFTWLVVVAPVPLVINEGLLRTLHLWPEAGGFVQVNTDPKRDSIFTQGLSDVLDYAKTEMAGGRKPGINTTIPFCGMSGERHKRAWPSLIAAMSARQ
jgi:hypothetical protein